MSDKTNRGVKASSVVVNAESLTLDDDGTISLYFTEALALPEYPDHQAMYAWAERALDPSRDGEANVSIVLDLPAMVKDLLGTCHGSENVLGGFTVKTTEQVALTKVKEQLQQALALFDRVTYSDVEVTAEIRSDVCHPAVYEYGESMGIFALDKKSATAYCAEQTKLTGRLHDFHFVGGRAHVKALPASWKHN